MFPNVIRTSIGIMGCFILLTSVAPAAGKAFHDFDLEHALVEAQAEDKYVFVDFYTTWCPPCKLMDQQTFPDATVTDFLIEKTIAIRIDAEKELEIAQKYMVEAYPTFVFINPDGTEKGRMVGFHPPELFIEAGEEIVGAMDPLARAQRILEAAAPNDPVARYRYARAMIGAEQPEPALEALLWCFDEGSTHQPDFESMRMSVVIDELAGLARVYAPAKTAINTMRRDRVNALLAMESPTTEAVKQSVAELALLNRAMNDTRTTASVYDRLKAKDPNAEALGYLAEELFGSLREDRQYEKLVGMVDIPAKAEAMFGQFEATRARFESKEGPARTLALTYAQQKLITGAAAYYEVLLGAGQAEAALKIRERLLELAPVAETYNNLAWAGYLCGQEAEGHEKLAATAWEMDAGRNVAIIDTYVRLLNELGNKEKAREVLQQAYATVENSSQSAELQALGQILDEHRALGRQMQ